MEVWIHNVSLTLMWWAPVKIALKTKYLCIDSSYSLLSKHDINYNKDNLLKSSTPKHNTIQIPFMGQKTEI